jgi:hypothetical protein
VDGASARTMYEPMDGREADDLRRFYRGLPTSRVKWRCPEGQTFLHLVDAARGQYGTAAVADALDVSVQAVHYMLGQRQPGWGVARHELPSEHAVRDVKRAHARVVELRLSGRQARRGTREYRDLHLAIARLTTSEAGWSLEVVATASRLPLRELRRFVEPPTVDSLRDLLLEDLEAAWVEHVEAQGPALAARTGRHFLQLLDRTVDLGVTRSRIGNRLRMTPERVSLLMSVGMAGLRKNGR